MKNSDIKSQEQRQADLAPETHNDEQDDHRAQAHEVSRQARALTEETASPTEGTKVASDPDTIGNQTPDTIDLMRTMEDSGKIDMGAFSGEPDHDDNQASHKTRGDAK